VEAILKERKKERNWELIGIVYNAGINPESDIYSKIWNDGKGMSWECLESPRPFYHF
jgi:hypothetical protein